MSKHDDVYEKRPRGIEPAPQPAPSGDEADDEFHAHCLNLTVEEARLICECGSGMRTHVFGGHRSCEYFEHHCDSCHERGICTAHVPVLSKLLALVPVPGAPSGDEAKVIDEIAERWITHPDPPMGGLIGRVYGAVREALAVGKADRAREEREALGEMLLKVFTDGWAGAQVAMRDAIARRGSTP